MRTGFSGIGGIRRNGDKRIWVFHFTIAVMLAATRVHSASIPREANDTLHMPANPSTHAYRLANAFPELEFTDPVAVVTPPGENNKLFVVQQDGRIILINNLNAPTRTVFLDLSDRVAYGSPEGEGGTLGMAFHPNYAQNGYVFVYYLCNTSTADGNGRHDRLSRFTRSQGNPGRAEAGSEVVLFTQYDEEFNHNGGTLLFGPDGYLYITLGDEGYPEDPFDNGQRIDKDFFAGVMRIDVDHKPGSLAPKPHPALGGKVNYWIPPDNPWVGATSFNGKSVDPARVRTEFWAVGLRSPWRMFYDAPTGYMYVSDVGEVGNNAANRSEEINLIVKGGNYGWPYVEADQPGPKANEAPPGFSSKGPLVTYERGNSGPFVGRA
ncbi:MAG TPA: PQQ-dependent sugar dehydrogenase, partial [Candidatus Acidoferrum sp.]|nr:PQQ-dependent sugar dehydrogenase [Candidatus Acidoferrum sp.]